MGRKILFVTSDQQRYDTLGCNGGSIGRTPTIDRLAADGIHLRTIHRDGLTCRDYLPGTLHDGTEGELYDHSVDPLQQENRWDDPAMRATRDDLVSDLLDQQPHTRAPRLELAAPV